MEWERYRRKLKGMGEIQQEARGNERDIQTHIHT